MVHSSESHILVFLALFLCGGAAGGQGQLLLKSGFEGDVQVTEGMGDIVGVDGETGFDWEARPAWIDSSRFVYLVGKGKTLPEFMASSIETATGPFGNETRVLRMENRADDPDHKSTSRNEYSFFVKKVPEDYRQGYVRYWMKLQDNLGELHPKDEATPWYMVMEWKEPNSGTAKSAEECKKLGQGAGGSNNYRINVHIGREANAEEFRWYLTGQHPQPCRKTEWRYVNPDVAVPLGRWFLVEGYMKKHATDGRVYFAVDGRVVLDTNVIRPEGFVGRTEHAGNPLPLRFWSPLKNYHSMAWNHAGPISQWYDEFELWSDFPPGHPAARASDAREEVIFAEHFDYPDGPLPGRWWSEGDVAKIRNGRLHVDADAGQLRRSTIWLDRIFHGDLRVEYDVCVLNSADVANNMNLFFLYSDPSGSPLRDSKQSRADGNYPRYHKLNGYIFTNVANGDGVPARFRFRDCPGFNLVAESRRHENRQRTVYHVTIEKRGNRFTCRIDGHLILDATDEEFNPLHDGGLMGFRTWHTELWWDNFVVTRL
ncbi:MAG: DUF1961 family protein [Planctomycetota bacterium]|jgi:hypothetical protein